VYTYWQVSPSPQSSAQIGGMQIGDLVLTQGLKKSEMNNIECVLLNWYGEAGRWSVRVQNTNDEFRVKPQNLALVTILE